MQYQERPVPVVRLIFSLTSLLPYQVDLSRNNLQILVSAEAAEQPPLAQGPKPVVSRVVIPAGSAVELPVVSGKDRKERAVTVLEAMASAAETNGSASKLRVLGSSEATQVQVAIGRSWL